MKKLRGISASKGIAIARAYKITMPNLEFKRYKIKDSRHESARFIKALKESLHDLKLIKTNVLNNLGNRNAHIFQSHINILSNHKFTDSIQRQISYDRLNAEWALTTIAKNMIHSLCNTRQVSSENRLLEKAVKAKVNFIKDVTKRILSHLLGRNLPNLALIREPVILVAHDLVPSDLAQLNTKYVKGAIADLGGKTAHSAIMARTLKMPAVVGIRNATQHVSDNDCLAVDGTKGTVIINPTLQQVTCFTDQMKNYHSHLKHLKHLKGRPTVSKDGFPLQIAANINNVRDIDSALSNGAEGIGLYRTEFLFMNASRLPTEEEQFKVYRRVLLKMIGKPVTFRTMDIGGDKRLPYLSHPKEHNPFLGYRGIRFCLTHTDIFCAQLRAMLRAIAATRCNEVSIIFPLVTTVREFLDAKAIYEEERHRLESSGIKIGKVKIGMMIETPAAAILADKFAKVADSVSIGTNDLVQFMLAADRGNNLVANLYLPFDPSIIRLIKHVVDCCHRQKIKVGICGEMASNAIAIPLLLGMGINELSMSSVSILKARSLIHKLSAKKMRQLVQLVVKKTASEIDVIRLVHRFISTKVR